MLFSHALPGGYLDEVELVKAIGGMLTVADTIHDELLGVSLRSASHALVTRILRSRVRFATGCCR